MVKYNAVFIVFGIILLALGAILFNALKFWAIISIIFGLIALIRGLTLRTSSKKEEEKETKEELKEENEPKVDLETYDAKEMIDDKEEDEEETQLL